MDIEAEIDGLKKKYGYTTKEIERFIQREIAECNGLIDREVAINLIKKKIGCKDNDDKPLLPPPKKNKFKTELLPPLSQRYKDSIWDAYPVLYQMDGDNSITSEEFDTHLCGLYLNDFIYTEKETEDANRVAVKCPKCKKLMRFHEGYYGVDRNIKDEFGDWKYFKCNECGIDLQITTQFDDFL